MLDPISFTTQIYVCLSDHFDGARRLSKARFRRNFRSTQASARAVSSWTPVMAGGANVEPLLIAIRWLEMLAQFSLLDERVLA